MCVYPSLIQNKKYTKTKKNGGNVPPVNDKRTMWVAIGCGKCIECKRQKALQWKVRLLEETRENTKKEFITLTFSNEKYTELYNIVTNNEKLTGYEIDNEIATLATRRFLERWRAKHGKSIKHWLVTELGQNGTENIHLHGIVWTDKKEEIEKMWQYGYVYIGEYVNEQTVNYIVKYIMKMDEKHKKYNPKVLTSKGIGKGYLKRQDAKDNKFKGKETREYYKTRTGHKLNLPIYYRNHIYTDEEKEELWINKLDNGKRFVLGQEINTNTEPERYLRALREAQKTNRKLGYGTNEKEWKEDEYEEERRQMLQEIRTRIEEGITKEPK